MDDAEVLLAAAAVLVMVLLLLLIDELLVVLISNGAIVLLPIAVAVGCSVRCGGLLVRLKSLDKKSNDKQLSAEIMSLVL